MKETKINRGKNLEDTDNAMSRRRLERRSVEFLRQVRGESGYSLLLKKGGDN